MWIRFLLGAVLLLPISACSPEVGLVPTPTPDPTPVDVASVQVACPDSLVPAVTAAASTYQRDHPELELTVLPRADSLAASALTLGDADIVLLTWLPDDLPEDVWARPVGRDGLAVIVHPQNGLPGLTMTQLQDLFEGRLEDWALWGGLPGAPQLVARETASGDYAFFQAWVMRNSRVSLNALLAPSSEAALRFVSEDQLAVGYVSNTALDGRVRAVAVNSVPPSNEAVAAGLYPLTRTIFLVLLAEPSGPARDWVQWMLEPPGQAVLKAYGYAPPPE